MRRILAALIPALTCASGASAADISDVKSVERFVARFVDQVNKGQAKAALDHFATDVSITEDLAPFHWTGPAAGSEWLDGMQKNGAQMGVTDIRMTLGTPAQVLVHGNTAYEAISGVVTLAGKHRLLHERGMLTFSLAKRAGAWKITSLTWGGAAAK